MAWKEKQERKADEEEVVGKKAAESQPPAPKPDEGEGQPDNRRKTSPKTPAAGKAAEDDNSSTDSGSAQDATPSVPSLPSDLSRWQEHDFFIAKLLEKPELLEVIARSVVDRRDDEEIVRILTRLLQPEVYAGLKELVFGTGKEEATVSTKRRVSSTQRSRVNQDYSHKVIDAAVESLAQNTTAAACRTLAQLIVGDLATEDNGAASTAALTSLAAHPTAAHEEMLFRIAVEAGRLVDTAEPAVSPEVLSRQAFELLGRTGSSAVRVRAAEYLGQDTASPEVRRGLEGLLSSLTVENLDAHVTLYMGAGDPKPTREVLAEHFAACSSGALGHLLGVKVQGNATEIDRSRKAASLLWRESFALVVEGRLNRLDSWSDEPALLALALSLPTDTMRAALARRLSVQWEQGPGLDASQLLSSDTLVEPGCLVLVRSMLEERRESRKLPSSLVGQRNQRTTGGRIDPPASRQQQEWLLQDAWTVLAGQLAADWCARCRTAAHDRDAAERAQGRRIDWCEGLNELPIQPHSSSGVVAAHRSVWGSGTSAGGPNNAMDPLALHYVRIEERTRPVRLLAYYDRAVPKHQRREIEQGICFEGTHSEVPAGVLRSIDVRITRAGADVRRSPDEEQDLVVEILAVTIRDPGESSSNGPN